MVPGVLYIAAAVIPCPSNLYIRPNGAVLGPVHRGQERAERIPTDRCHRCRTAKKKTPRTWGKKPYFTRWYKLQAEFCLDNISTSLMLAIWGESSRSEAVAFVARASGAERWAHLIRARLCCAARQRKQIALHWIYAEYGKVKIGVENFGGPNAKQTDWTFDR